MAEIAAWKQAVTAWHKAICSCGNPGNHFKEWFGKDTTDGDGAGVQEGAGGTNIDPIDQLLLAAAELEKENPTGGDTKQDTNGTPLR